MLDDRPGRSCGKPPEKITKGSLDNVNRVSVHGTGEKPGHSNFKCLFHFTRWSMISTRLSGWLCIPVCLLDLPWLDDSIQTTSKTHVWHHQIRLSEREREREPCFLEPTVRIRDGDGSRPWPGPGVPRVERSVSVGANQLLAVRKPRNGAERFAGDETGVGHFGPKVPQDDQTGLESHQQLPINQVENK